MIALTCNEDIPSNTVKCSAEQERGCGGASAGILPSVRSAQGGKRNCMNSRPVCVCGGFTNSTISGGNWLAIGIYPLSSK